MVRQILLALTAPLHGLWILVSVRTLWPYALAPLLLGVAWSAMLLLERFAVPELAAIAQWYGRAFEWSARALLWVSVAWIQVLIALTAPLLDWLAEQTEEALGVVPRGRGFWRELLTLRFVKHGIRSLLEALKLLGFKLCLLTMGLVLGLLPFIGPPLGYVLAGLATGVDFIDYPLARRRYTLAQKLTWARAHWLATLTFCAAVSALLSLPAAAALLLPACVVGGTDLVFRLSPLRGDAQMRSPAIK